LLLASLLPGAACRRSPLAPGDAGDATGGASTGAAAGTSATGAGATAGTSGTGAGGARTAPDCAQFDVPARPTVIPSVLLLLDASGTMNQDVNSMTCDGGCGAASKWAHATAAVNALVAATETSARWGLKIFADSGACGVSAGVRVPTGTGNAAAIANAIAARTSATGGVTTPGNTPIRAAEAAAASYLTTTGDPGRQLILLVTDGATNCGPGDINADDSPAAVQAVADALSSGFPTIVVGASAPGGPNDAALTALATAGGLERADDASSNYYPLSAIANLAGTLAALTSVKTDCVYALPARSPTGAGPNISVRVDGVAVPRDTNRADGWDWVDTSLAAVQIFGPLCDELTAGKHATVTFVYYCDTR